MDNEIVDLLRAVAQGFQVRMKEQLAAGDTGLAPFQARLINLIGRTASVSQLQLGVMTERDKAQVARAIQELEAGGYIVRAVQATDKRAKSLTLTPAGRKMHVRLNGVRQKLAGKVLGGLDAGEKQALHVALQKVASRLREGDQAPRRRHPFS